MKKFFLFFFFSFKILNCFYNDEKIGYIFFTDLISNENNDYIECPLRSIFKITDKSEIYSDDNDIKQEMLLFEELKMNNLFLFRSEVKNPTHYNEVISLILQMSENLIHYKKLKDPDLNAYISFWEINACLDSEKKSDRLYIEISDLEILEKNINLIFLGFLFAITFE